MNPQKDIRTLKIVASFIVMALALYPVFELTRCIIQFNLLEHWSRCFLNSYAELVFIWVDTLLSR